MDKSLNNQPTTTKHYVLLLKYYPDIIPVIEKKYEIKDVFQFDNDISFIDGLWPQRHIEYGEDNILLLFFHFFSEISAKLGKQTFLNSEQQRSIVQKCITNFNLTNHQ